MVSSKTEMLALVTGGGSGIGLATAAVLAAEGYSVVIAGRNEASLGEAAASLNERVVTPPYMMLD